MALRIFVKGRAPVTVTRQEAQKALMNPAENSDGEKPAPDPEAAKELSAKEGPTTETVAEVVIRTQPKKKKAKKAS